MSKLSVEQISDAEKLKDLFNKKKREAKEKGFKLSQETLALDLDMTQGAIGHFLNARSPLSLSNAIKFADALGVTVADFSPSLSALIPTAMDNAPDNVSTVDKTKKIPVLNYVQAGVWTDVEDNQYDKYITALTKGDGLFALKIEGFSMISEFYPEDIIEVNPNIEALTGDYVVAVDKNNKCTFKQYKSKGIDEETGKEWFELIALNKEFGIIDSRQHPFEIVGVAVAKTAKLRRGFN